MSTDTEIKQQIVLAGVINNFLKVIYYLCLIQGPTYLGFKRWSLIRKMTESKTTGKSIARGMVNVF